jgi:DNA polymerase-3 subunit gamma/tau
LELARVLSCEEKGDWKCACSSCALHRYLHHDDLLVLGKRSFSAEISACSSAFLQNQDNVNTKLLLYRSFRKLMLRFSPVLMEDDPKLAKTASIIRSLDEGLNELMEITPNKSEKPVTEKLCGSLIKNALTLESEGLSNSIPIAQIRSASSWCFLAPSGKHKTLILENADNMREEARNSLLKLLEEPPKTVSIVMTAKRREAIMPTILSRLRPYRFLKRNEESEKEIIRRVFQVKHDTGCGLSEYLDSFLPQSTEKLYPLAAWFIVSLARITSV